LQEVNVLKYTLPQCEQNEIHLKKDQCSLECTKVMIFPLVSLNIFSDSVPAANMVCLWMVIWEEHGRKHYMNWFWNFVKKCQMKVPDF